MAIVAPYQYLTQEQVDDLLVYLLPNDVYQDWIDLGTSPNKDLAIYRATVIFDGLPWKGYKLYDWQDHAFPRKYNQQFEREFFDVDISLNSTVGDLPYQVAMGFAITSANVLYETVNDVEDPDEILTQGFSRINIGSLSVDLASSQAGGSVDLASIPDEAAQWIRPWSLISRSGRGVGTFRMI